MRADYCIVQREVPAILQPYPAEDSNKTPVAPTAPSFEAWSLNKQKVEINQPSIFPRLFILFMDLIFTRIGEQNMAFSWKIASIWVMFHLTWNLIQTKSVPQTTGQTCPPHPSPAEYLRVCINTQSSNWSELDKINTIWPRWRIAQRRFSALKRLWKKNSQLENLKRTFQGG